MGGIMRAAATKLGIAGLVVVIAGAYVAALALYANSSTAHTVMKARRRMTRPRQR